MLEIYHNLKDNDLLVKIKVTYGDSRECDVAFIGDLNTDSFLVSQQTPQINAI